jgi:hypothetical protein
MHHQANVEPAFGDHRHHGIDQEGHVVGDDLDHRDRAHAAVRLPLLHRLETDFRRARTPGMQERPGFLAKLGQRLRRIAGQIVGDRAAVQLRQKILWNVRVKSGKRIVRLLDQPARGMFFFGA